MIRRFVCFLSLAVSFTSLLYASTAIASEIIYSTLGPGQSYSQESGWPVGTLPFPFDETQKMEAAVSFTPSQSYTFESIDVAALLDSFSASNQFSVSLARDSGSNLPGAILEAFSFTGLADVPAVYSSSSVLHPQLTAGERYWLVMSSDELLNIYLTWLDTDTFLDGEIAYKNGLYTDWAYGYGSTPAFEVRGTTAEAVPEPTSMLLMGLGLVVLAGVRGRAGG
jgi:hypothetical protein